MIGAALETPVSSFNLAQAAPYLAPIALVWLYYRRIRRSFGRQPWRPVRHGIRLALLSLVAVALVVVAVFLPHVAWGMAGGGAAGIALGLLSLRHTHAEWTGGEGSYTPNPWIGGALTALLLARLAWRWSHGAFGGGDGAQASPLTLAMAAALVAYSLTYQVGLLAKMRRLAGGA